MTDSNSMRNAFEDSYFPDDWNDADLAFLADFIREEFGAEFVALYGNERDWDYALYE